MIVTRKQNIIITLLLFLFFIAMIHFANLLLEHYHLEKLKIIISAVLFLIIAPAVYILSYMHEPLLPWNNYSKTIKYFEPIEVNGKRDFIIKIGKSAFFIFASSLMSYVMINGATNNHSPIQDFLFVPIAFFALLAIYFTVKILEFTGIWKKKDKSE